MAKKATQLIRLARLGVVKPPKEKGELAKHKQSSTSDTMKLLLRCKAAYDSLAEARKRRKLCRDFKAGRQWDELVYIDGSYVKEKDYIRSQGQVPIVNNIFASLLHNVVGQYRNNPTKTMVIPRQPMENDAEEIMTNAINAVHDLNYTGDLDAQLIKEKALSGTCSQRVSYDYFTERDRKDVKLRNVNFNRLFFNTDIEDIRVMDDLRLIGEIHDCTIDELLSNRSYCKGSEDEKRIREWYGAASKKAMEELYSANGLSTDTLDAMDFLMPTDPSKCRVIEVWELRLKKMLSCHDWLHADEYLAEVSDKAEIERINRERIAEAQAYNQNAAEGGIDESQIPLIEYYEVNEQVWCTVHLTPNGNVLFEAEDPFEHGEHPYILSLDDLIDGEVYGIAYNWIPQQKGINRNAMLLEMLISSSAKNLLMIPEETLNGKSPEEFGDQWARIGGYIVYKPTKTGAKPEAISSNSTNVGIREMLHLYLDQIKSVSGIYGAIQGQEPTNGTPASRYMMETQNASTNMLDFFEQFSSFKERRDRKVLKCIKQFYTDKVNIPVIGTRDNSVVVWNPEELQDVDVDVKILQGAETPAYRTMVDNMMSEFVFKGLMPFELYLEHSSESWTKPVLASINKLKEDAAQAQQANGSIPPEIYQQLASTLEQGAEGADPKALELLKNIAA